MLMDGHIFACIRFSNGFHSHPRTKWTSVIVSSCWLKKPDPVIGMQSISRFPQAACDSNSANNTSPMKNRFSAGSPRWLHVVQNAMRGRGAIFSAPAHAAQQESYFSAVWCFFADMSWCWHYGCTWAFLVRNSAFNWVFAQVPRTCSFERTGDCGLRQTGAELG